MTCTRRLLELRRPVNEQQGLLLCTSATSAHVRFTAVSEAKRTSAGAGTRWLTALRAVPAGSGRTKLVRARRPSRREPRVLAPALAGRCALWPRSWPGSDPLIPPRRHTPARRHAVSPMTLVDAHRAARRDSPVLPVRIFPVAPGLRSGVGPDRRERPEDQLVVSGRASRIRRGRPPARLPWVVPTAFRYRLDHVLGHNPLPARPRTLTEQALWKPVIGQISTFKSASR